MKKKSFVVIVIFLILIILGLCAFIVYDKDLLNLKGNNTSVKKEKNAEEKNTEEKTESYDLAKAEELLNRFGFNEDIGCFSSKIYDGFYSDEYKQIVALNNAFKDESLKTSKKCSEVYSSDQYSKEHMGYKSEYGVCKEERGTSLVSYENANKIYKSMYGTDMPKKGLNSTSISSLYYKFYDYIESLDSFAEIECGGCGGACGGVEPISITKTKSANIKNNELVVEVYHNILELNNGVDRNGNYKFVTTIKDHNIKLDSKDIESAKKEIEEKHLDKLDVYEVKFTKKDGNYIFKSFIKKLS